MQRRNFLESLLAWLSALALSLMAVIPAGLHTLSPVLRMKKQEDEDWVNLGALSEFDQEKPSHRIIRIRSEDGWQIRRQSHAVYVVFDLSAPTVQSSICPHLACPLSFRESSGDFYCGCHGSLFDSKGQRTDGPAPREMDRLPSKVVDGILYCRWVRYRAGLSKSVEV